MKYPVVGLARALALWGTPSHDAGRRARSRGAPCEGEGQRREGGVERSERYLDGRDTMGKRAEVEHLTGRKSVAAHLCQWSPRSSPFAAASQPPSLRYDRSDLLCPSIHSSSLSRAIF